MRIVGIYLAAGNSKRFGANKLIQNVGQTPLGSLALRTAVKSDLEKVIVVIKKGDPFAWIPKDPSQKCIIHAICPENSNGQSDSLECGVRTAVKYRAEAVLIMLADQPLISKDMINSIISKYLEKADYGIPFVSSTHQGIPRPPVLFPHYMYQELFDLRGDAGARDIIRNKKWAREAAFLEYSNPNHFFDIDTQENYQALLRMY